jgi:succinyl-diaminopimelate desuccinylase
MQVQNICLEIEKLKDEVAQMLMELIRIPAVAPESGGEGELQRAEKLVKILQTVGFDKIERYDAEDERVPSKKRPNIIAYCLGENEAEKLWIVTHMDMVPPGEESLWTVTKPFEPKIANGRVYGRSSEDNLQSLVASIFAVKALKNLGIKPKRTVALTFVADEEQGSKYGIKHLLKLGLFKKEDLAIVPDGGNEDGSFIEIAEKSVLWLKIATTGKQTHASTPQKGLNAHRIGMQYSSAMDKMLHEKYSFIDEHFDPPGSTFEPTRKDKNVDAVNIIPAEDVTYFDCRILPNYDAYKVLEDFQNIAREFEKETGAKIDVTIAQKTIAPKPTDANSKIVLMLEETIRKIRGKTPKIGGIGGGTCAAYFREKNIPAVVWSTCDETAHQPNEYAIIQNILDDAKIFATLAVS